MSLLLIISLVFLNVTYVMAIDDKISYDFKNDKTNNRNLQNNEILTNTTNRDIILSRDCMRIVRSFQPMQRGKPESVSFKEFAMATFQSELEPFLLKVLTFLTSTSTDLTLP